MDVTVGVGVAVGSILVDVATTTRGVFVEAMAIADCVTSAGGEAVAVAVGTVVGAAGAMTSVVPTHPMTATTNRAAANVALLNINEIVHLGAFRRT